MGNLYTYPKQTIWQSGVYQLKSLAVCRSDGRMNIFYE
jgi:hypothetical protein